MGYHRPNSGSLREGGREGGREGEGGRGREGGEGKKGGREERREWECVLSKYVHTADSDLDANCQA